MVSGEFYFGPFRSSIGLTPTLHLIKIELLFFFSKGRKAHRAKNYAKVTLGSV
jgi:hypothetical protein